MKQLAPLLFKIFVVEIIKKFRKIADHNITIMASTDKLDSSFCKVNIILFVQICPIGNGNIMYSEALAFFVVSLIENKIIELENTAINMCGITNISMLLIYPTLFGRIFAHIFSILDKGVEAMFADILRVGNVPPTLGNVRAIIKMSIVPLTFSDGSL